MEVPVCRICLNSSVTLVDIFAKRENETSLEDMLNECADCHIKSNDGLSQQICLNCVLSAQSAFRFKRTCEQSYRQLVTERKERQNPIIKLEREIKVEPPGETKLHKCPHCIKEFAHLSILSLHKKWHQKNKSKQKASRLKLNQVEKSRKECSVCKKKFKTITLLKKHLTSHSNLRPFPCPYCPKSFKFNTNLKRHMRTHTGERPYQCPFCTESFARSDYCRSHMEKVHTDLEFTGKLSKST